MRRSSWLFGLAVFAAASCGDDKTTVVKTPTVSVAGKYSLAVGDKTTLTPSTKDGTDTSYTFASNNEAIATVMASGEVTAVAAGETTITVTGDQTKATATHPIVVLAAAPTPEPRVVVTGNPNVTVGETLRLTATTVGGSDAAYTWTSSNIKIATVDASGGVVGVAPGTVTITAKGQTTEKEDAIGIVVSAEIPYFAKWLGSGHADVTAEAFTHWNTASPAEVPTTCATCHSTPGFLDFLGEDGTAAGTVEAAAKIGTVVECRACHNAAADALASVTFPSGATIGNLGAEARCMTCHQGRGSTDTVNDAIGATADDTVSSSLRFINQHYYAAGATLYAGQARGGYQYAGKVYDWRFRHVKGIDTCTGCHDPHSLQLKTTVCKTCHSGVSTVADIRNLRMVTSGVDYDGDGNTTEGLHDEVAGLGAKLLQAIIAYPKAKSQAAICYSESAYPYFLKDTDGDGTCQATETDGYDAWTPRLLRAAYNYQVYKKDPGAYAHNGKYMIQLLYDSIADLNTQLGANAIDITSAVRNDPGHFNGAGEAARHWDQDDAVSASCSKCHAGSGGLDFYLKYGVGSSEIPQDNGLDCATCHAKVGGPWDLRVVDSVTFPGDVKVTDVGNPSNLCATCHSGRESGVTVNQAITASQFSFKNVHYLSAAGVWQGSAVTFGAEYPSMSYAGKKVHVTLNNCTHCHAAGAGDHSFSIKLASCTACHPGVTTVDQLRSPARPMTAAQDYDGNGTPEALKLELAGMRAKLLTAIQAYATTAGHPICYGDSHPYWFADTNANGTCETSEQNRNNAFANWDAKLMRGGFNYQLALKEEGAWAHNFNYVAQLLYDGVVNLGGSTTGMVRP